MNYYLVVLFFMKLTGSLLYIVLQMAIYIINTHFYFDSELCSLYNQSNGKSVKLFTTSANCLALLLENKGILVEKKHIFENVWYRYNLMVTDNAYYQCILNLRRQIAKVGLDAELIKTIPRKGLLLSSSVTVYMQDESYDVDEFFSVKAVDEPDSSNIKGDSDSSRCFESADLPRSKLPGLVLSIIYWLKR